MCDPVIFPNIRPALWASIETQVRAAGIDVEHDQGVAHVGPTDIQWDYEPSTQSLTVQCLHKPWIASCGMVNQKITDLFQKALFQKVNAQ